MSNQSPFDDKHYSLLISIVVFFLGALYAIQAHNGCEIYFSRGFGSSESRSLLAWWAGYPLMAYGLGVFCYTVFTVAKEAKIFFHKNVKSNHAILFCCYILLYICLILSGIFLCIQYINIK